MATPTAKATLQAEDMEEVAEVSRQAVAADAAEPMEGAATEQYNNKHSKFQPAFKYNHDKRPQPGFHKPRANFARNFERGHKTERGRGGCKGKFANFDLNYSKRFQANHVQGFQQQRATIMPPPSYHPPSYQANAALPPVRSTLGICQ